LVLKKSLCNRLCFCCRRWKRRTHRKKNNWVKLAFRGWESKKDFGGNWKHASDSYMLSGC